MRVFPPTKLDENRAIPAGHSVLIVDDHAIVREGLAITVTGTGDFHIWNMTRGSRDTLQELSSTAQPPDLAIIDLSLPDGNGIDLIRVIRERCPGTKILVLSMHGARSIIQAALTAGAHGYLLKEEAADLILIGLKRILAGERYLGPAALGILADSLSLPDEEQRNLLLASLSPRERELLRLIGTGRRNAEIARDLGLSPNTIDAHKRNLKRKLQLDTTAELAAFAARLKL